MITWRFPLCLLLALPLPAQTPAVPYRYGNVAIVGGGMVTGLLAHPGQRGLFYVRTGIGGAYRWDAGRWTPLLDWLPFAERNLLGVESMAIDPTDPRKLYLAAGTYVGDHTPTGAILRSSDAGRHFETMHIPVKFGARESGRLAGERLQVDPNHSQTLLLATRLDGLWRSDDSGVRWSRVSSFSSLSFSDDGLTFVAFDKSSGRPGQPTPVIFVGVADPVMNLQRSQDGGRSWQPVNGGPRGMFPNHGVFGPEGTLYLSYADAPGPNGVTNGAVAAFRPQANQWRDITPLKPGAGEQRYHGNGPEAAGDGQGFGYGTVAVDPAHPGTVLASTLDRWHPGDTVFRSTDGGAHWQSLRLGATRDASLAPWLRHTGAEAPFGYWIGAAAIDPFDPGHVFYGTGETVWESHDASGGAPTHWTVGAAGIENTAALALLSPDLKTDTGPHLYTGLGEIGCFRHDDLDHSPAGGAMKNPELSDCDSIALAAGAPEQMVRVGRAWPAGPQGAQHGALSHDGGQHWTPFASEPEGAERGGQVAISGDAKLLLWALPGLAPALSSDGGEHWRSVETKAAGPEPLQVLPDEAQPEQFWVYDPNDGRLSLLHGPLARLIDVTTGAPKNAQLRIAAETPDTLWLAGGSGLFRSTFNGTQWTPVPKVAKAYAVGFGKPAPGAAAPAIFLAGVLAGTPEAAPPRPGQSRAGAIYRSTDDGTSWQRIDDADHRFAWIEQITGDPRVFGRVYLGTNGRGVLMGDPVPAKP